MEDLPLGRIAALMPEFAVKDLPLGRTLMMMKWTTEKVWIRRSEENSPPLRHPGSNQGSSARSQVSCCLSYLAQVRNERLKFNT